MKPTHRLERTAAYVFRCLHRVTSCFGCGEVVGGSAWSNEKGQERAEGRRTQGGPMASPFLEDAHPAEFFVAPLHQLVRGDLCQPGQLFEQVAF